MEDFGKIIKHYRIDQDLTQRQFSILSGVPQYRLTLIERGLSPRPEEKEALVKALSHRHLGKV